jgi:type I restriction enzyme M protein
LTRLPGFYGDFKESEISKIFNNEDFGYSKITVERPLRLAVKIDSETLAQTKKLLTLSNVFVDNEGVAEEEALTYALNNPKARTIAIADTPKQKQAKAELRTFYKTLVELKREEPYYDLVKFGQLFTEKAGLKFDDFYQPSAKFNPCTFIVTTDPQAEIIKDKKGKPVPDANSA